MAIVGIDLGVTTVRAIVADEDGRVLGTARQPTPNGPEASAIVGALRWTIQVACGRAGVDVADVTAVGVGSVGPLDPSGVVEDPPNLDVDRIPVAEALAELVGTDSVSVLQNATAGVLGERAFGPAATDNMVYLSMAAGIDAGVFVDGRLLSGRDGNAGLVGHLALDPGGLSCPCGGEGHWEAYCSGEHIPRLVRHLHDGEDTALSVESGFRTTDVFEAAETGDDFAASVLDRLGEVNARGVATMVQTYAPESVVVGGLIALDSPDLILDPIRRRLPELTTVDPPEVRLTALGEDVVARGALASVMPGASVEHELPRHPTG